MSKRQTIDIDKLKELLAQQKEEIITEDGGIKKYKIK